MPNASRRWRDAAFTCAKKNTAYRAPRTEHGREALQRGSLEPWAAGCGWAACTTRKEKRTAHTEQWTAHRAYGTADRAPRTVPGQPTVMGRQAVAADARTPDYMSTPPASLPGEHLSIHQQPIPEGRSALRPSGMHQSPDTVPPPPAHHV